MPAMAVPRVLTTGLRRGAVCSLTLRGALRAARSVEERAEYVIEPLRLLEVDRVRGWEGLQARAGHPLSEVAHRRCGGLVVELPDDDEQRDAQVAEAGIGGGIENLRDALDFL